MLGFTEILKDETLSIEERSDAIKRIESSGRALLRLIDDVLDISKNEADKIEIRHTNFSPLAVATDVIELLRPTAERKGLELRFRSHPSVPNTAYCDPARVRQILVNLIGNAIKFTDHGEVVVSLRAEDKSFLVFEVCDTGIGIAEKDQGKLFQPFAQADESISRTFGGTGLGLLLSMRLAERMGGGLWLASSHEGQGSHFIAKVFSAPFDLGHRALEQSTSNQTNSTPTGSTLKGFRVLIAEDVADNRVLIDLYLRNSGAEVVFAVDGAEAIEKATTRKFDLVLMDIQMPKIDGIQAVRTLRSRGYSGPIVALTAHAMAGEIQRSIDVGFDGHLSKPVTKQALIRTIEDFASHRN